MTNDLSLSISIFAKDLVVYFDPEYVTLDEFNGDAMSVPGVIGISYGIVVNTNIVEECTEGFVLHDGTHITRQNNTLLLKVYRQETYDNWFSVSPNCNHSWEGWIYISSISIFHLSQNKDSTSFGQVRESAECFMTKIFKPEYSSFVEQQRVRQHLFAEHFSSDGSSFDMKEYVKESAYNLTDILAYIGNHEEYDNDERRILSTLFNLICGVYPKLLNHKH